MNYIEKKYCRLIVLISILFFCLNNLYAYKQSRVVLITKQSNEISSNNTFSQKNFWQTVLIKEKLDHRLVEESDISSGLNDETKLVIIPEGTDLEISDLEDLADFVMAGGSVLAFGDIYYRRDNHDEESFEALKNLFNVDFIKSIDHHDDYYLSFFGNTPITKNFSDTFIINIPNKNNNLKIKSLSKNIFPICFWENHEAVNRGNHPYDYFYGGVYGTNNQGKVIWLSAGSVSISRNFSQKEDFNKLAINMINWLTDKPAVWCASLSKNYSTVVINSIIIDNELEELGKLLNNSSVSENNYEIFIRPEFLSKNFVSQLNDFKVGLFLDKNISLKYHNKENLYLLLAEKIEQFEKITQKKAKMIYSASGEYDEVTLEVLNELGVNTLIIENQFLNNNFDSKFDVDLFVVTGHTNKSMREKYKVIDPNIWHSTMMNDFQKNKKQGKLFISTVYTSMLVSSLERDAFFNYSESLNSHDVYSNNYSEYSLLEESLNKLNFKIEDKKINIYNNSNREVADLSIVSSKKIAEAQNKNNNLVISRGINKDGSVNFTVNKLQPNQQLFVNLSLDN